jgi:hypothetical protein
MATKHPPLKEEQLVPMQQVIFVPVNGSGRVDDPLTKHGMITSVSPSGFTVYCRFWPHSIYSEDLTPLSLALQTKSQGCLPALLHPAKSLNQTLVAKAFKLIYYDSIRISSKIMAFLAKMQGEPLSASVEAGIRGERKVVSFQDLNNRIRISFTPSGGWEIIELSDGVNWKARKFESFLNEIAIELGAGANDEAYLALLNSLPGETDPDPVTLFYNMFKFEPIVS